MCGDFLTSVTRQNVPPFLLLSSSSSEVPFPLERLLWDFLMKEVQTVCSRVRGLYDALPHVRTGLQMSGELLEEARDTNTAHYSIIMAYEKQQDTVLRMQTNILHETEVRCPSKSGPQSITHLLTTTATRRAHTLTRSTALYNCLHRVADIMTIL
jgi:hypothetical protein